MNNDSANAFNYLEPHKRLTQRIMIAQLLNETPIADLDGSSDLTQDQQDDVKKFLIQENILDSNEAESYTFVAKFAPNQNTPSKIIDLRDFTFNIFAVTTDVNKLRNSIGETLQFIESLSTEPPWGLVGGTIIVANFLRATGNLDTPIETKITDLCNSIESEALETRLNRRAKDIKDNGSKFRILQPSKKLSQLIAETWIEGRELDAKAVFTQGRSDIVNGFLLGRGLISRFDAQHVNNVIVDRSTKHPVDAEDAVYVGEVTVEKDSEGAFNFYNFKIPYPDEPNELVNDSELLERWVESEAGAPFTPVEFSPFIPLSC